MLIILEGVDGSGKSSLARDIVKQLRTEFPHTPVYKLHAGPLDRDPVDEYINSLKKYVPDGSAHVVIDRWHYGEDVYGPLYRGKSAISSAMQRWMDLALQRLGAQVWVVTNTLEEINRRLHERGEDFLKADHVERVLNTFNTIAENRATFAGALTVDGNTARQVYTIIDRALYAQHRAQLIDDMSSSYVGRTFSDPQYLLVGDRRGGTEPFPTTRAFYPTGGNSGDFLWTALPDDLWQACGAININDDEKNAEDIVRWFEDSKIVALGRNAQTILSELGFTEFGVVPHPQFIRRFAHQRKAEYGKLIVRAGTEREDLSSWLNS